MTLSVNRRARDQTVRRTGRVARPARAPGALVLADGRAFTGLAAGARGTVFGEVVFNTAMTGYQEVLTDPSYRGQLVTMTTAHIGNYGVQPDDGESGRVQVAGLIVRKLCSTPDHHRSAMALPEYLELHGICALEGLDTRALVRHVRERGAQPAVLTTELDGPLDDETIAQLAARARAWGEHTDLGLGRSAGAGRPWVIAAKEWERARGNPPTIVAWDFGMKTGIVRQLSALGCRVQVVPASFPAAALDALQPDGVFLSNGPGDPRELTEVVDEVRKMLGRFPIFGICLGHQLLALALGGRVEKLRFGHRGANHPVLDRARDVVEITSQNHGYAVVADSLPAHVTVSHVNLNDDTVAGIDAPSLRAFSVQYHPEACPGPHDAHHHFLRFRDMLDS